MISVRAVHRSANVVLGIGAILFGVTAIVAIATNSPTLVEIGIGAGFGLLIFGAGVEAILEGLWPDKIEDREPFEAIRELIGRRRAEA